MSDFKELTQDKVQGQISTLLNRATEAEDAGDAMKLAQAALNASQILYALRDMAKADEHRD